MGYEFPVHVSNVVWQEACLWNGSSCLQTSVDKRIYELVQACYEGMLKKLTQHDGFLFYTFKHWAYKRRATRDSRKKRRLRYGARLFVDETGAPWLYIFDPKRDKIEALEKGTLQEDE
jgi:hypothetical protein